MEPRTLQVRLVRRQVRQTRPQLSSRQRTQARWRLPPAPSTAAAPSAEALPAVAAPAVESTEDKMDQLAKLKQLLDVQALTQEEFDAQKARILASM